FGLGGRSTGAIGLSVAGLVSFPAVALKVVAMFGLLAAVLAISVRETGVVRKGRAVGYATAAIAACAALPQSWTALKLSEYKGLSQTLLVPGVTVLAEHGGLYTLLT